MIELLINDGQVRQTCSVLKSMLKHDADDALLLAYGYMDSKTLNDLNLSKWLGRCNRRRIMLVFGLHDKGEINDASKNPKWVEMTVRELFRTWDLPNGAQERVLIYAVEHFHAKFAVVGKFVDDAGLANAFTMDQSMNLLFSPREVVFGSSNLTYAALHEPNVELDAHILRGSASIGAFAAKMHTVLSRAISLANEPDTFSNDFTLLLRSIMGERIEQLRKSALEVDRRAMDAYSDELIKSLMDPDK
jgi:hypothetical protein